METLPFLLIMEFCQLVRAWGVAGRGEGEEQSEELDPVGAQAIRNDVIIATPVTREHFLDEPSVPRWMGFPCSSVGKESACNAGDLDSFPGLGRSPGEGNGNPLQYSCLENPMVRGASQDRGAWQATVHGVARVNTT